MKKLLVLALGLVAVLVLAGQLARAAAGPGPRDPQDRRPVWAPDGAHLAFERQLPGTANVLELTAAPAELRVARRGALLRGFAGAPDRLLVQVGSKTLLVTGSRLDPPLAVLDGTDASASPDGTLVAYLRDDTLYVASADGTGERAVAAHVQPPSQDVLGPVWSPDGTRVAVAAGSSLVLVNADGSGVRTLFTGAGESVNPSWSANGQTLAFERNAGPRWQIWVVGADGTGAHELLGGAGADYRFPQFSPLSDALAYTSDRQHLKGRATPYQYALYLRSGPAGSVAVKLLDDVHAGSPPSWSRAAPLVAVAAAQECRRFGIYVVQARAGGRATRRSNVCRVTGTSGADRIHGSPYFDLIRGLGGNDVILGGAGNDRIEGNNGDDRIAAGAGNDVVFGGPGNDHLYGGPGNDLLIGGPGRDVIDCGPGVDTVEGVGPLDRVAANCEHVRH